MKLKITEKALFAAMMMVAPISTVYAKHLDPQEALARIEQNSGLKRIPGISNLNLVYTEEADNNEMVYVFNKESNGFIVVAADDRMPALLGYSDHGSFDYESAPPALKWLLSQYADEASQSVETLIPEELTGKSVRSPKVEDRQPIEALIKTKWGQDSPFNLDCPDISGYQCVTGCVATALAQIIKYYGYPSKGSGTNKYNWNGESLEFDFSAAEFDYANMLDLYNDITIPNGKVDATEAQEKAVANLMYACGIAVNMKYNLQSSSASDVYIPYALQKFFNYDNARYLKRSFFLADEWESLIYSELKEGRPVIYGGQTLSNDGHQFICDGYNGEGLFHINWGWEGLSDGYYRLTALSPEIQGTGGFDGGYNCQQSMICYIQPKNEFTDAKWYPIYAGGSIWAEPAKYTNGTLSNEALLIHVNNGLQNISLESYNIDFEIKAVSETGQTYFSNRPSKVDFAGIIGSSIASVGGFGPVYLPSDLPAGRYKCYLVIRTPNGDIQDILYPVTDSSYFILDVDANGNISCSEGEPIEKAVIRVSDIKVLSDLVSGTKAQLEINIDNEGEEEYSGYFTIKFFKSDDNDNPDVFTYNLKTIPAFGSVTLYPSIDIMMKPGAYEMICFDKYDDPVSDAIAVVVGDSGVDSILEENAQVDIFSASGMLIMRNVSKDAISSLKKGIYIMKANGKSVKFIK